MNRWHTHPSAHGSYVLDGTLVSPRPPIRLWFPEGGKMQHGASPTATATATATARSCSSRTSRSACSTSSGFGED